MTIRQSDGQYEMFTLVERTVKEKLAQFISSAPRINTPVESMLAGAMAMALCYIHRVQNNKPVGTKINPRILVVTGSTECASQYMTYMNVFFTAQKEGIVIDVCALDKTLSLLQQGADITGGHYLKLPQIDGFLQYLLVSEQKLRDENLESNIKSVISVGIFARSKYKTEVGAATTCEYRLSGGVFLSSGAYRYRICLFCLSFKWVLSRVYFYNFYQRNFFFQSFANLVQSVRHATQSSKLQLR